MILIDTNVVPELMRLEPAPAVLDWFTGRKAADLFLSAVSEVELRAGAAYLPPGRRRGELVAAIDAMVTEDFGGRVLPFDSAAAKSYAVIAPKARRWPHATSRISSAAGSRSSTRGKGDGRLDPRRTSARLPSP